VAVAADMAETLELQAAAAVAADIVIQVWRLVQAAHLYKHLQLAVLVTEMLEAEVVAIMLTAIRVVVVVVPAL
jgi:hypothetical protein